MKGKATFTKGEVDTIISLIRKKVLADAQEQKRIRDKIRALGFYASEFGIGGGYNEQDFLRVVKITGGGDNKKIEPVVVERKEKIIVTPNTSKRKDSDEAYIIALCDEVLKLIGSRQHKFDFLKGDAGTLLPVDAFYPSLNLVIEYRERQHTEEVKFFNRRQTVSGVNRGEQRKIYDLRRRDILPKHGIKLIEFGYDEFEHDRRKRLVRDRVRDLQVVMKKLNELQKL